MLSEETLKKIKFGTVYTADPSAVGIYYPNYINDLNDQRYSFWIPAHYKKDNNDAYYMIDTYQIKRELYEDIYTYDKEKYMQSLLNGLRRLKDPEDGGNYACRMPYDYYYSAIVKITNENINIFKEVCNLEEYRLSNKDECRYFDEKDVVKYLKLFNGHEYPDGIIIVRKDAKYNYNNLIEAKLYDIIKDTQKPDYANDYYVNDLKRIQLEAIENKAEYNKEKLEDILKYNEFLKDMRNVVDKYIKTEGLNKKYYI